MFFGGLRLEYKLKKINDNLGYVIGSLLIVGYVFLITREPLLYSSFTNFGFSDTLSYLAIAHANSLEGLRELSSEYPFHHLERWPIHLLTGLLTVVFKANDLMAYRTVALLCMFLCMWLISTINASPINKLVYFAFIVLNPYTFMISLFAPPMVADSIFIVAMVSLVVGLVNQKYKFIWLALFLGLISRQNILMIVPIVIGASLFLPSLRRGLLQFLVGFVIFFVAYKFLTGFLFGDNASPLTLELIAGLYFWFKQRDSDSMFVFLGSLGALLLTLGPLFLFRINRNYWQILVLGVACIVIQPILSGPVITGGNAARLIAFSIPFIGLFFINKVKSELIAYTFIGLLAFNMLHHNYSSLFAGYQKEHYFFILLITFTASLIIRLSQILKARHQQGRLTPK